MKTNRLSRKLEEAQDTQPSALDIALKEYRAAHAAAPQPMEAGWLDDFQQRRARLAHAVNGLLSAALVGEVQSLASMQASLLDVLKEEDDNV